MYQIGRLCVKIAGRDAGLKCIIIDHVDMNTVLIDGQTRRRKCNIRHIEPLDKVLKVSKNAPRSEIIRVFKELNIEIKETKPRKKAERPVRVRKKKEKPAKQDVSKHKPAKPVTDQKHKKEPEKTRVKVDRKTATESKKQP